MRFQVVNRGEYVLLKGRVIEIRLAGTRRAAEATEIDCQNMKSCGRQSISLNPPTLLVELSTVSEHNRAGPLAIEIGANSPTIVGGKRDARLCRRQRGYGQGKEHSPQHAHAGNYTASRRRRRLACDTLTTKRCGKMNSYRLNVCAGFRTNDTGIRWSPRRRWVVIALSVLACRAALCQTPPILSLTNVYPPSTLLAPGATSLDLSFNTPHPDTCGYSVNTLLDLSQMQPADIAGPTATHQVTVTGLNPDPQVVNQVYIRCASAAGFWDLEYRVVAAPGGDFPRIGSIWGGAYVDATQPAQAAKIQLYLSPGMTHDQVTALRAAEPGMIALLGADATYTGPWLTFPDDYYLKDIHGNKIQIALNGVYLLNLTMPKVAQALANDTYQLLIARGLVEDGVFLDNVFTTISWIGTDVYGNPVQICTTGDGVPDDPVTLDAKWRAGVLLAINTLRSLVPWGYLSAHPQHPNDAQILPLFNGSSQVFEAVDVREGQMSFGDYWQDYQNWFLQGLSPELEQIQSGPPNIISYGYGYEPMQALPASSISFAQTFYPNMRFGLATALMNDGFFTYDLGDTQCCVNWWYDEYDFHLGQPLGPAVRVGSAPGPHLLTNAGFENGLSGWSFFVDDDGQASATVTLDNSAAAEGNTSAHIDVASADSYSWQANLYQTSLPVVTATNYQVQFWARSDAPRLITVDCESGNSPYTNYGLDSQVWLDTTWRLITLTFVSSATAGDGQLQFDVGDVAGNVWIDGVELFEQAPDVFRRDFSDGVAVLNGTLGWQTVTLEPGFQRFKGAQAPLYQYIVDDSDAGFGVTGSWNVEYVSTGSYDTAIGPWYNAWGYSLQELDVPQGTAQWNLSIPADGQYTIQVWLPNARGAAGWTKNAQYQIVSGGKAVASASLDQSSATAGDQWHTIFSGVALTAASSPVLTISNAGAGPLIADAVYITSVARYNDGSAAPQVTLAATDGILLQRQKPVAAPASKVRAVVDAAGFQPGVASGAWVTILGSAFTSAPQTWMPGPADQQFPMSLGGVSVTINGIPAYIDYVSPGQINAIAPDDPTLGQVAVQVTTAQGNSYPGVVVKQRMTPEFFMWASNGTNYVAARHADGTLVGPAGPGSRPAQVGEEIELYATGFGPTNPPVSPSQLIAQPVHLAGTPTVSIGGVSAVVNAANLVEAGLYQLNVTIPSVPAGDQPVQAQIAGFHSRGGVFVTCASQ